MFVLQESILASANRRAEAIRHVIRGGSPRTFDVLNRQWLIGRDGAIYHYRHFEPTVQEMSGLTVYRFAPEDWQLSSRLFASHVRYTEEGWLASTGWEREFDGDLRDDTSPYRRFENQVIDVEPPSYFVTEQPAAERMTYRQLDDYIGELSASGFNVVAPHGRTPAEALVPLRDDHHDADRGTVCRDHRPPRDPLRHRSGNHAGHQLLDHVQCVRGDWERGAAGPDARGLGAKRPLRFAGNLPRPHRQDLVPARPHEPYVLEPDCRLRIWPHVGGIDHEQERRRRFERRNSSGAAHWTHVRERDRN